MDEVAAAYLHEEGLPYFTMFGQGSRPYTDLKGTYPHLTLSLHLRWGLHRYIVRTQCWRSFLPLTWPVGRHDKLYAT